MAAPSRSFKAQGPFSLGRLAQLAGAELRDPASADRLIADVGAVHEGTPERIVYLARANMLEQFGRSLPGACIAAAELASSIPDTVPLLISRRPQRAFALIAQAFYPRPQAVPGIAPNAVIDAGAELGPDCQIEPGVVIYAGAKLGARVVVGANSVIGEGAEIGDDCILGPLCSVRHAVLGPGTTLLAGARIGEAGFGFVPDPPHGHIRLPQLGRVVIGAGCEIGANTTIDRGAFDDTVIGDGTIIDNQVQIGHNVRLGRGCVAAGQVGLSGSVTAGDFVVFGGQAGVADHIEIGSGARIAAGAGVMRDVPAGDTISGRPAVPIREHMRQIALLGRLAQKKGMRE